MGGDGPIGLGPVRVTDPLERFALLASAVGARALGVARTDRPRAFTDGEAVHLPDGLADDERTVAIVVQAALLAAGSLDRRVVADLVARRSLGRRYLALEAHRAVMLRAEVVPDSVLRAVVAASGATLSTSAEESMARARSAEAIPEAPDVFGAIVPRRLRTEGAGSGGAPSTLDQQGRTEMHETPEMDDEEESESLNVMKALATPMNLFGDNPFMKWLERNLGIGRRPSPEGGGAQGEMPAGGATWGDEAGEAARPVLAVASRTTPRAPEGHPGRLLYPEWDAVTRTYRAEHCLVRQMDPPSAEPTLRPDPDPRLQRELARLGLDYERHRRQEEGPDLDLEAVVDFTVARARRRQPDDRLYQVRLKTARDLAVLVLLDASGSTGDRGRDGVTVFERERQVVADLVGVLDALGDRVGAFAFSSKGRGLVRFHRIKEFDARLDATCLARLAGVRAGGYTRLGAAIRHSTHLLSTVGRAANKALVVVSDGLPFDDGYEGPYAEHDTRRALAEAAAAGVGCLCLSVGHTTGDAALARLWGEASQARIDGPAELADALGPLLRSALVAASRPGGAGAEGETLGVAV